MTDDVIHLKWTTIYELARNPTRRKPTMFLRGHKVDPKHHRHRRRRIVIDIYELNDVRTDFSLITFPSKENATQLSTHSDWKITASSQLLSNGSELRFPSIYISAFHVLRIFHFDQHLSLMKCYEMGDPGVLTSSHLQLLFSTTCPTYSENDDHAREQHHGSIVASRITLRARYLTTCPRAFI